MKNEFSYFINESKLPSINYEAFVKNEIDNKINKVVKNLKCGNNWLLDTYIQLAKDSCFRTTSRIIHDLYENYKLKLESHSRLIKESAKKNRLKKSKILAIIEEIIEPVENILSPALEQQGFYDAALAKKDIKISKLEKELYRGKYKAVIYFDKAYDKYIIEHLLRDSKKEFIMTIPKGERSKWEDWIEKKRYTYNDALYDTLQGFPETSDIKEDSLKFYNLSQNFKTWRHRRKKGAYKSYQRR